MNIWTGQRFEKYGVDEIGGYFERDTSIEATPQEVAEKILKGDWVVYYTHVGDFHAHVSDRFEDTLESRIYSVTMQIAGTEEEYAELVTLLEDKIKIIQAI